MDRDTFETHVEKAIQTLPDELRDRMENVVILVQDYADSTQLAKARVNHREMLLGLYEGVPLTKRGTRYGLVVPDRISIFQKPIESRCRNNDEIADEIQRVVIHEIAHHFGISDARLREIEMKKRKAR
jgi:predicted Zn-dependent protease with MMP-like domain